MMKFTLTERGMVQAMPNPASLVEGWAEHKTEEFVHWVGQGLLHLAQIVLVNAGPICMGAALLFTILRMMGSKRSGKYVWWSIMGYIVLMFIKEVSGL